jgi:hypothetical protein
MVEHFADLKVNLQVSRKTTNESLESSSQFTALKWAL